MCQGSAKPKPHSKRIINVSRVQICHKPVADSLPDSSSRHSKAIAQAERWIDPPRFEAQGDRTEGGQSAGEACSSTASGLSSKRDQNDCVNTAFVGLTNRIITGAPPTAPKENLRGVSPKASSSDLDINHDGDYESPAAMELRQRGETLLESERTSDHPRGIDLLFKAVDQGSAHASYRLGLVCAKAQAGMPRDEVLAAELWEGAANRCNQDACFALGCCYEQGRGVKQDFGRAVYFWKIAAQRGQKYAMFMYKFSSGDRENAAHDPNFASFMLRNARSKQIHKPNLEACMKIYAGVVRRRCLYS